MTLKETLDYLEVSIFYFYLKSLKVNFNQIWHNKSSFSTTLQIKDTHKENLGTPIQSMGHIDLN